MVFAAARLRWAFAEYVNDCHKRGALSFLSVFKRDCSYVSRVFIFRRLENEKRNS